MTVLVTGSTGTVGSEVVRYLAANGTEVRALTRSPEKAHFSDGVTPVKGDLMDPDAMRAALAGVNGLFLLSAVTADELTGTLITLSLAQEAGVQNIVYLSVIYADRFIDAPHMAAKGAAERMIADRGIAATILRPGYYMQNDASFVDAIRGGVYPQPLGNKGVLMVDARDLGEVAARCLLRRESAGEVLPGETVDVVAPEILTADAIAALWAQALGRPVTYGGDDLDEFERQTRQFAPGWMAYDLRMMLARFQQDAMVAAPGDADRLQALLGRPMRSYRDFVRETAAG